MDIDNELVLFCVLVLPGWFFSFQAITYTGDELGGQNDTVLMYLIGAIEITSGALRPIQTLLHDD